jgi:hypothetical protein
MPTPQAMLGGIEDELAACHVRFRGVAFHCSLMLRSGQLRMGPFPTRFRRSLIALLLLIKP